MVADLSPSDRAHVNLRQAEVGWRRVITSRWCLGLVALTVPACLDPLIEDPGNHDQGAAPGVNPPGIPVTPVAPGATVTPAPVSPEPVATNPVTPDPGVTPTSTVVTPATPPAPVTPPVSSDPAAVSEEPTEDTAGGGAGFADAGVEVDGGGQPSPGTSETSFVTEPDAAGVP
jgi:hypothetical protein